MRKQTRELFDAYLDARLKFTRAFLDIVVTSTDEYRTLEAEYHEAENAYCDAESQDGTCKQEEFHAGVASLEATIRREVDAYKLAMGEDSV